MLLEDFQRVCNMHSVSDDAEEIPEAQVGGDWYAGLCEILETGRSMFKSSLSGITIFVAWNEFWSCSEL